MNIKEINKDNGPTWWVLLALGLPLALVTVALPLGFDSINRRVRQYARSRPAAYRLAIWIIPIASVIAVLVTVVVVVVAVEITKK